MPYAIALYVVLVIVAVYGWAANIVALIASVGHEITALFVLRCLGVFVPFLGAVLGFVG